MIPDPNVAFPRPDVPDLTLVRPTITRPNIEVGDYTYFSGRDFESHVTHHYPFYILGWTRETPDMEDLPMKGDTVVGNDVWIGQNVTILPGVSIGDGAIIGAESVVAGDVAPYTIVAGNPARLIRRRFDEKTQALLERLRWWDRPPEEIERLIPLLSCGDLERVRRELAQWLQDF